MISRLALAIDSVTHLLSHLATHTKTKKGATLLSSALLCACTTLGPEYKEPDVAWLSNWQPDLYGTLDNSKSTHQLELSFWWQLFDDAALNQLIEQGYQNNIDLRIAGLRILESRAQLGIVGSLRYPQSQQISGSAIATESRRRGGSLPDKDQDFVSYQTGLSVGWELDFWGKFQRSIEGADAAFFTSVANQQNMQVLLTAQIADLYFAYRTLEQRIEIANKNIAIQRRSYEITEKVYKEGQDSELDLQQAKAQYLATLSVVPTLQLSLINTRNAISLLLARPPGNIAELHEKHNNSLPVLSNVYLQDIPANILIRRPDIRSAAWQVAAQSTQIGIAEADYYPSISLLGSLSWSGSTAGSSTDNGILGIGPGFNWNIFDHGRIANNIRVQDARFQQSVENYQKTVLSAAHQVDNAAVSIVKTAEQMDILSQAVNASERALALANTRYREGYSSFQRVLDAQRSVFANAEQSVINQGNHIKSVVSLYKAFGGGWKETPLEQVISPELKNTLIQRTDWGDILTPPATLPITTTEELPKSATTTIGVSQHE